MIPLPSGAESASLYQALDAADHESRVDWIRSLGKSEQRTLYEMSTTESLSITDMHGAPGEVVIHEGRNSLPVFTSFQKRVCLFEGRVQGYNEQALQWLTGPGHFLLRASEEVDGELWFDYHWSPDTVPELFPEPRENTAGFSRFVYAHMIDILRRVSTHVTIGRAIRKGKATENYFALCRAP